MIAAREKLLARFFKKVARDPDSDCLLWTGSSVPTKNNAPYGQMWDGERMRRATHVSWFLKYGVWPTKQICHTCDNPPCIRIKHLFEGTNMDNHLDAVAKGRVQGKKPAAPPKPRRALTYDVGGGEMLTTREIADRVKISVVSVNQRIRVGIRGAGLVARKRQGRRKR